MPKRNIKVDLEGESPVCFFYSQQDARLQKKTSITLDAVIEKLRLFTRCDGTNLQLSDSLDASRVTNPGKMEAITCFQRTGDDSSLPCEARWHGLYARHQPRSYQTGRGFLLPVARSIELRAPTANEH